MNKLHDIKQVKFEEDNLILSVDNRVFCFPLAIISQKLFKATETERNIYQISPSGYGIHWLIIDEDLSIDGLLRLAESNNFQLSQVTI